MKSQKKADQRQDLLQRAELMRQKQKEDNKSSTWSEQKKEVQEKSES